MRDLYNKIRNLIPVKDWSVSTNDSNKSNNDFRDGLSDYLDLYVSILKKEHQLLEEKKINPDVVIKQIEKICNKLKRCVELYFDGRFNSAYNIIKDILSDNIFNDCIITISKGETFYRARKSFTSKDPLKEIFHIPLNKRGIISTQRFSTPGYPCLYLGSSINACWEELERPNFDSMMVSRFVVNHDFRVWDLRIPNENDFINNLSITLIKLPLVIASSICVLEHDASFKPEYIIPQFIIEYILSKNRDQFENKQCGLFDFILGVYYTSSHINDELKFPDKTFDNLALPAVLVEKDSEYCQLLASYFGFSKPTSYGLEDIRRRFEPNIFEGEDLQKKTEEENNYKYSKMGIFEDRLNENISLNELLYLVPDKYEIEVQADGKVEIKIRANVNWNIE